MENLFLSGYLIVLSVFDGKERKIPVVSVCMGLFAAVVLMLYRCFSNPSEWKWAVLSAVLGIIPGGVMLVVAHLTGKAGCGDGLILMVVGIVTGYRICILLICFSLMLMSVWCIGVLCCRKGNRNTKVPYLPFLAVVHLAGFLI